VAGVVSMSMLHPWLAAGTAGLLLCAGLLLVVMLWQRIRRFRRARRRRAVQAASP
jgi:hypothetical protein